MERHHGDTHHVTNDSGNRTTCNSPTEVFDEYDVEDEVDGIVDENGQRHQFRTTIDTDHRVDAPQQ